VVTAADVTDFRTQIGQLETVAFADVQAVLGEVDDVNPLIVRDRLLEIVPELVGPYASASGEIAAAWYEDIRGQNVPGTYYAETFDALPTEKVDALVRYAVSPLFDQSFSTVLSLLSGGLQRVISNAARDTITNNVAKDPVQVGYARFPQAGCCAFCAMLAGRGAVYNTAASAGGVQGRGVDASVTAGLRGGQGRGVKTRGSQEIGSKFHDFCHCVVAPVFVGDEHAIETRKEYEQMYLGSLSDMRQEFGIR
jgi:hypothetical protein